MLLVERLNVLTVLVLFGLESLLAAPQSQKPWYNIEEAEHHFKEFLVKYNKHYATKQEMEKRFQIFKKNLQIINEKNNDEEETAIFGKYKYF
jgi:hypothetical protein